MCMQMRRIGALSQPEIAGGRCCVSWIDWPAFTFPLYPHKLSLGRRSLALGRHLAAIFIYNSTLCYNCCSSNVPYRFPIRCSLCRIEQLFLFLLENTFPIKNNKNNNLLVSYYMQSLLPLVSHLILTTCFIHSIIFLILQIRKLRF